MQKKWLILIGLVIISFLSLGIYSYKYVLLGPPIIQGEAYPGGIPQPICSDSDGGQNFIRKGETCIGNDCVEDYCEDRQTLIEYYCDGKQRKSIQHNCDGENEICLNGACISQEEICIEVWTPEDLDNVRNDLDACYTQMTDIDLEDYEFEPIGNIHNPFTGTYNGNNYRIINFFYDNNEEHIIGIFGYILNAKIINTNVIEAKVFGRYAVGALVGLNRGRVVNSFASGKVFGIEGYTGMLVGDNRGIIENSRTEGVVKGESNGIGGLTGSNGLQSSATILSSSSNATVIQEGDTIYSSKVGGLVGQNWDENDVIIFSNSKGIVLGREKSGGLVGENSGNITNSYSSARVNGTTFNTGGLVGLNIGLIKNSFAFGEVIGNKRVGGLVGLNSRTGDNKATIENSYAKGDVHGTFFVGGLVGMLGFEGRDGIITNSYSTGKVNASEYSGGLVGWIDSGEANFSYWDINTSGKTQSAGGEPRTTSEMTSVPRPPNTYVDWDFVNIWDQTHGNYPWLKQITFS